MVIKGEYNMKKFLSVLLTFALIVACLTFTACVPSTPEKAVKKLEKAEYTIITNYTTDAALNGKAISLGLETGSLEGFIRATNGGSYVEIFYCENRDAAKALEETLEAIYDNDDSIEVERSGKKVYYGTEQGIKAID